MSAKLLAAIVALGLLTAGAGAYAYNMLNAPLISPDSSSVDTTPSEGPTPACPTQTGGCCRH
jgi:hypothetical protein